MRTGDLIAVDLDGVLAQYDGWKGIDQIGDPMPNAAKFIRALMTLGSVMIYSTRTCPDQNHGRDAEELAQYVTSWLRKHEIPYDSVWVGDGKPAAVAYIDDRAVTCRPADDGITAYAEALLAVQKLIKGGREEEREGRQEAAGA